MASRKNVDSLKQKRLKSGTEITEPNNGVKGKDDKKSITTKPLPANVKYHLKRWTSCVTFLAIACTVYFTIGKDRERNFALKRELIEYRFQPVDCSYQRNFDIDCMPKRCGRFVTDTVINMNEIETLLEVANKSISLAGSNGGQSTFDLHSGFLSNGSELIDFYSLEGIDGILTASAIKTYETVRDKIHKIISEKFQIDGHLLYLTSPSFFSRITNRPAKAVIDEYWHQHFDKDTYPLFDYTSLIYLSDYAVDFHGGRFMYVDGIKSMNRTLMSVEPRKGRLNVFTSGSENRHFVENVTSGTRFALTISFTCNKEYASDIPN